MEQRLMHYKLHMLFILLVLGVGSHSAAVNAEAYVYNSFYKQHPEDRFQYDLFYSFSWDSVSNEMLIPCSVSVCYLGVSSEIGSQQHPRIDEYVVPYVNGEKLSIIRERFISKVGVAGDVKRSKWLHANNFWNSGQATTCFRYYPDANEFRWGVVIPGTACAKPGPLNVTCDPLTDMLFDFGTVSPGMTSGLQISSRQMLSCSQIVNFSLKLISSDFKLSQTMTADMTVNGMKVDSQGFKLKTSSRDTPLDFVMTIRGNEVNGGVYSASDVLLLEIW
jgi:hypothetical protein